MLYIQTVMTVAKNIDIFDVFGMQFHMHMCIKIYFFKDRMHASDVYSSEKFLFLV